MTDIPSPTPQTPLQPEQGIARVVIPESKAVKIIRAAFNILISLGYIAEIAVAMFGMVFSFLFFGALSCDDPNSALCHSSSSSLFSGLGAPIAIQGCMFLAAIVFIATIFGKQTEIKKAVHWLAALPLLYVVLQFVLDVYF